MTYELFDPLGNPHRECSCCGSRQKYFICKDCHAGLKSTPQIRTYQLPREMFEEYLNTTCGVCDKLPKNHTYEELEAHERILEELRLAC